MTIWRPNQRLMRTGRGLWSRSSVSRGRKPSASSGWATVFGARMPIALLHRERAWEFHEAQPPSSPIRISVPGRPHSRRTVIAKRRLLDARSVMMIIEARSGGRWAVLPSRSAGHRGARVRLGARAWSCCLLCTPLASGQVGPVVAVAGAFSLGAPGPDRVLASTSLLRSSLSPSSAGATV